MALPFRVSMEVTGSVGAAVVRPEMRAARAMMFLGKCIFAVVAGLVGLVLRRGSGLRDEDGEDGSVMNENDVDTWSVDGVYIAYLPVGTQPMRWTRPRSLLHYQSDHNRTVSPTESDDHGSFYTR